MTTALEHLRKAHGSSDGGKVIAYQRQMMSPVVDFDTRMVRGTITTTTLGIDGLIVPPDALDEKTYFWGNDGEGKRTVYWNHDRDRPIGKCESFAKRKSGVFTSTYITRAGIGEADGDTILTMIAEGIITGFSCGMRIYDTGTITPEEMKKWRIQDEDAVVVRRAMLLEYSVTPMPADPGSVMEMAERCEISESVCRSLGLLPTAPALTGIDDPEGIDQ